MKNYTIHHNSGKESFLAFGRNEAIRLFKTWALINGVRPVFSHITE